MLYKKKRRRLTKRRPPVRRRRLFQGAMPDPKKYEDKSKAVQVYKRTAEVHQNTGRKAAWDIFNYIRSYLANNKGAAKKLVIKKAKDYFRLKGEDILNTLVEKVTDAIITDGTKGGTKEVYKWNDEHDYTYTPEEDMPDRKRQRRKLTFRPIPVGSSTFYNKLKYGGKKYRKGRKLSPQVESINSVDSGEFIATTGKKFFERIDPFARPWYATITTRAQDFKSASFDQFNSNSVSYIHTSYCTITLTNNCLNTAHLKMYVVKPRNNMPFGNAGANLSTKLAAKVGEYDNVSGDDSRDMTVIGTVPTMSKAFCVAYQVIKTLKFYLAPGQSYILKYANHANHTNRSEYEFLYGSAPILKSLDYQIIFEANGSLVHDSSNTTIVSTGDIKVDWVMKRSATYSIVADSTPTFSLGNSLPTNITTEKYVSEADLKDDPGSRKLLGKNLRGN